MIARVLPTPRLDRATWGVLPLQRAPQTKRHWFVSVAFGETLKLAPELAVGRETPVEDRLADLGLSEDQVAGVQELVEQEAAREGFHKAATLLVWVGERLRSHSSHAAAVAEALGLHGGEGLAAVGARVGCSKQALSVLTAKVAAVFPETAALSPRERATLVRSARRKERAQQAKNQFPIP